MPRDAALDMTDDATLLARYARGDAAAARLLTERLVPRIYAQAFRMLGDGAEAEDVAQDAMMRLWKIAPEWRTGEAQVTTWLYRVVANLCTDRLRKRPRRTVTLDAVTDPPDPAPSAEARLLATARQEALNRALADLPERQRLAVMLRHFEGASNTEIADAPGYQRRGGGKPDRTGQTRAGGSFERAGVCPWIRRRLT